MALIISGMLSFFLAGWFLIYFQKYFNRTEFGEGAMGFIFLFIVWPLIAFALLWILSEFGFEVPDIPYQHECNQAGPFATDC